jgi:hypothetical protein
MWLAILVELEKNCISPFVILTFCSSEFVKFLIGYSPHLTILGLFTWEEEEEASARGRRRRPSEGRRRRANGVLSACACGP